MLILDPASSRTTQPLLWACIPTTLALITIATTTMRLALYLLCRSANNLARAVVVRVVELGICFGMLSLLW